MIWGLLTATGRGAWSVGDVAVTGPAPVMPPGAVVSRCGARSGAGMLHSPAVRQGGILRS